MELLALPDDPLELLAAVTLSDSGSYALTSNKGYHMMQRNLNATSYSQLEILHKCPRKFMLAKYEALRKSRYTTGEDVQNNVDFAFGHAVGAGVQNYLLTGSANNAYWSAFMAWRADFEDNLPKKKKSLADAYTAVELFIAFYRDSDLREWELHTFADGTAGIEVAYVIDCENGYQHYGHIDLVMQHKETGRIGVFEVKTHGFKQLEISIYENSAQAVGYATVLDTLVPGLTTYDVRYICYSAPSQEWDSVEFTHRVASKTEYLLDLVTDHSLITRYADTGCFPKRGGACYDFGRRCQYFGECNIKPGGRLPRLTDGDRAEEVNYEFSISQLARTQQELLG